MCMSLCSALQLRLFPSVTVLMAGIHCHLVAKYCNWLSKGRVTAQLCFSLYNSKMSMFMSDRSCWNIWNEPKQMFYQENSLIEEDESVLHCRILALYCERLFSLSPLNAFVFMKCIPWEFLVLICHLRGVCSVEEWLLEDMKQSLMEGRPWKDLNGTFPVCFYPREGKYAMCAWRQIHKYANHWTCSELLEMGHLHLSHG